MDPWPTISGGAEERWKILSFHFVSLLTGAGTDKAERARERACAVRGKGEGGRGISIWRADTVMLHVPDIPGRGPPLCTHGLDRAKRLRLRLRE